MRKHRMETFLVVGYLKSKTYHPNKLRLVKCRPNTLYVKAETDNSSVQVEVLNAEKNMLDARGLQLLDYRLVPGALSSSITPLVGFSTAVQTISSLLADMGAWKPLVSGEGSEPVP